MGLLKNLVRNGISEGISKGLSKGISDALGKAVEKAVNPAAERLAGKAAAQIDEASAALDSSAQAAAESTQEVKKAGGFAALENALNAYLALLKGSGFRQKYRGSDQVLLKTAGTDVWAVGSVDAMYDDTTVCLSFSRDPSEVK